MNPVRCPKCGKINDGTTYFCIYCGTIFDEYQEEDMIPSFMSKEKIEEFEKIRQEKNKNNNSSDLNQTPTSNYRIAIMFGYLFSILGGLIGLLIAIYLITRKDPIAKKHGKIQIGILVFWVIVMTIMVLSGAIDYHVLITPMNLTSIENMTTLDNISSMNNSMTIGFNNLTNMKFL